MTLLANMACGIAARGRGRSRCLTLGPFHWGPCEGGSGPRSSHGCSPL
eukprot:jgi/Botrbrau1/19912/Bobra.0059s0029.1